MNYLLKRCREGPAIYSGKSIQHAKNFADRYGYIGFRVFDSTGKVVYTGKEYYEMNDEKKYEELSKKAESELTREAIDELSNGKGDDEDE